jgi:5'-3' exonuclease
VRNPDAGAPAAHTPRSRPAPSCLGVTGCPSGARAPPTPRWPQGDQLLTTETGEVTSHLQGMFYRTTRLLEAGGRARGSRRRPGLWTGARHACKPRARVQARRLWAAPRSAANRKAPLPPCPPLPSRRAPRAPRAGMRPVYVFDGKPPELKRAQLDQRLGRREDADKGLEAAKEAGDQEAVEKYSKRTIKVGARGAAARERGGRVRVVELKGRR